MGIKYELNIKLLSYNFVHNGCTAKKQTFFIFSREKTGSRYMRLNSKGHSANAEKFYPSFFENISIADNT